MFARNFPAITQRLDAVALLDEFAFRIYQEMDYNLECANGIRIKEEMSILPQVVIPKNFPKYTSRRVHVAEWIEGEKLSQSKADDVGALVNLGVITYLTQLLEFGFFHADPHPGNMLRTDDGKLAILDFGLMTEITNDQKYGMIEAIAHLINRDYTEIGQDFINLDFIPKGTDTSPIVPALTKVFDVALAGGGAKSINFQELAADLAQITFEYPFRIPPYFALVIRAISVLEGIALVGNPNVSRTHNYHNSTYCSLLITLSLQLLMKPIPILPVD
jgi:aarF domain-containing kinase